MATPAKLVDEALALPRAVRAELAAALLRSLDGEPADGLTEAEWNAAWGEEIHRRIKLREAGLEASLPADEAIAAIREELRARRDRSSR